MRWILSKHGLPAMQTHFYADIKANVPPRMREIAESRLIGRPIIALVDDNRWTLVGTRGIAGIGMGPEVCCAFCEIQNMSVDNATDPDEKEHRETLILNGRDGVMRRVWLPRGKEFYAMCNLLLRWISAPAQ